MEAGDNIPAANLRIVLLPSCMQWWCEGVPPGGVMSCLVQCVRQMCTQVSFRGQMNAVLAVRSRSKAMVIPLKNNAPNISLVNVMYNKSIHSNNLECSCI